MLVGTGSVEELAQRSPTMPSLDTEPLVLPEVEIFQALYEIGGEAREALLPPSLHPTNPPYLTFSFWRATDGPLGEFTLAQLRIGCRSGTRPRGMLFSSFIDNAEAGKVLTERFGFGPRVVDVSLQRRYDAVLANVTLDGKPILDLVMRTPFPLLPEDMQYSNSLHPAHTPMGFRLVQFEPEFKVRRAERGKVELLAFDGAAWGDARLRPVYPVSASSAVAEVTLPRLRFVCKLDVLAFQGTEAIKQPV